VGDELCGPVHDFLERRANATAFGMLRDRADVAGQAELAHQAQAVIGKGS
jgi:hypothetical protein